MNYEKIYNQLIQKRQQNQLDSSIYKEHHHIIPRSLQGKDDAANIVCLTAKEHYLAHLLLVKITEKKYGYMSIQHQKMILAITYFKTCFTNPRQIERSKELKNKFTGRIYKYIRELNSKNQSIKMKGKLIGQKNGMYGRKHTLQSKQKIAQTRKIRGCGIGSKNPMYGKPCWYKMTKEEYKRWKSRISASVKGEKNPAYGRVWMHIPGTNSPKYRVYIKREIANEYLNKGYVFGMKN